MKKTIATILFLFFVQVSCAAETVIYNTNTGKYHKPTCASAKKCTKNCIKIDKKDAKAKGGVPCAKCGG